jgi:hypothetical protein
MLRIKTYPGHRSSKAKPRQQLLFVAQRKWVSSGLLRQSHFLLLRGQKYIFLKARYNSKLTIKINTTVDSTRVANCTLYLYM